MLIDWIQDSPGAPAFKTRFRDPALLRAYGYDAMAVSDIWAALPSVYQGAATAVAGQASQGAELPALLQQRIAGAQAAGLQVFLQGDALVLPAHLVEESPAKFLCEDGSRRLCPAKAKVFQAMAQLVDEAFERWPTAEGLILRTGEVRTESTPGLLGTPLHESSCPVCRNVSIVERLRGFLRAMFEAVVEKHGRILVHQTFQRASSGGRTMHDDPQVFREVTASLPTSGKLVFSFHCTRGEYREGNPVNPNLLVADGRPKWIEFQCERELEGKGAFPNFRAKQWVRRLREILAAEGTGEGSCGLSFLASSRGGGWGGPYLQREEWVDANVWALGRLYGEPIADSRALAEEWTAKTFGLERDSAATREMGELLELSEPTIRELVYDVPPIGGAQSAGDVGASFVDNDQIDVEAIWNSAARLLEPAVADAACEQKLRALANVERMRQMFARVLVELPPKAQTRDLANTLVFYNSFAGTVAHLFCGFVRYFQWQRTAKTDAGLAQQATDHLEHAQAHWQHHTQRHAMLPGAPSVFQETTLWERTNNCLEELTGAEKP